MATFYCDLNMLNGYIHNTTPHVIQWRDTPNHFLDLSDEVNATFFEEILLVIAITQDNKFHEFI